MKSWSDRDLGDASSDPTGQEKRNLGLTATHVFPHCCSSETFQHLLLRTHEVLLRDICVYLIVDDIEEAGS